MTDQGMNDGLKIELPSQGWKQFLTGRKEMLDAFDSAREKARAHKIETSHGKVAEAELRKWLAGFLPKRYGVTPGYIVSTGLKSTDRTPHFDVVVYDQLESPVLWVENSPDASAQGRSLAIPVEHVRCVLEVKSRFTSASSGDAVSHLRELHPLIGGVDDAAEMYKLYLPPTFCCGVVFYDLKESDQHSESALAKLLAGIELRGFLGGVVLRGEGHQQDTTGDISLLRSETPIQSDVGKGKNSLLKSGMCKSVKLADDLHFGAWIFWAEANFSRFAFDLLATMKGTYEAGRASSFYGLGSSQMEHRHD